MNRNEYMEQLKKRLNKLPFDETKEAVDYYEQYFDDAGEENAQAVIAELGSPSDVAAQILAEFAIKGIDERKTAKRGLSGVWFVILALFASPVALPLALAAVIVVLAIVIVMLAIILSVGATGLALFVTGVMCAVLSIPILLQSFSTFMFYLGMGLILFGVGGAIIIAITALSKKCFGWLAKGVGKFVLRRSGK